MPHVLFYHHQWAFGISGGMLLIGLQRSTLSYYGNAKEIIDIPEEWYQKLLLICNAKHLLSYLRVLTKLEANPQNGTKEPYL
jgi:hypothetical protein